MKTYYDFIDDNKLFIYIVKLWQRPNDQFFINQ